MRAYPLSDNSTTLEISNHHHVQSHLIDQHSKKEWSVVWADQAYWIEVNEGTPAHQFILDMQAQEERYPALNEHHYCDMQYAEMLKAITRIAERSGTIVISYDDAYDYLLDSAIEVIEDSPNKYLVMCSDEEFKEIIEGAFPDWKDY